MSVAVLIGDDEIIYVDAKLDDESVAACVVTSHRVIDVHVPIPSDADVEDDYLSPTVKAHSIANIAELAVSAGPTSESSFDGGIRVRSLEARTEFGHQIRLPLRSFVKDPEGLRSVLEALRTRLG